MEIASAIAEINLLDKSSAPREFFGRDSGLGIPPVLGTCISTDNKTSANIRNTQPEMRSIFLAITDEYLMRFEFVQIADQLTADS